MVTIGAGSLVGLILGPPITGFMTWLGSLINWGTEQQPFIMGIVVSVLMGMILTLPISSAFSRLAFAVATIGQPDILIVDEVLSVGDFHFQQKCEARINRMKENGTTILFVSHNMEQVRNLCSRIVWLEHGRVRSIGDADELCREYQEAE